MTDSEKKTGIVSKTRLGTVLAIALSVFLALVLWFYIQDEQSPDYTTTFSSVPVSYRSLPDGLSVISGSAATVNVTLSGKKSDLNKVKANDIEAFIDMSSITQAGLYEIDVTVRRPEGTEFSDCYPLKVQVNVDTTIMKSVPVQVLAGNYSTEADTTLKIVPQLGTVSVKGPKKVLDGISIARINTGDLGNVNTSFERNINIVLTDAAGNAVTSPYIVTDQKSILVDFDVVKTKTVPVRVDFAGGYWGSRAQYTVSPDRVTISGEPSLIDGINSICAIKLDETKYDTDEIRQNVSAKSFIVPEGVTMDMSFGEAQVSVSVADSARKTVSINLNSKTRVFVTPPPDGLKYSFSDESVGITVRGKTSGVSAAGAEDFYLNIDLSSCVAPGMFSVPAAVVQQDNGTKDFYAVGTYSVTVEITK